MITACTIIAGNYLAHARVLAESFFTHHPDGSFTVLVVDDERRDLAFDRVADQRIEWLHLSDLDLDAHEIHRLGGIYDVTELSTAVKPKLLQRLIQERAMPVIFLDPDIRVYASLACVATLADAHDLVLTPHVTEPIPDDGRQVDALFVLAAGVYNLGFIAVGPSSGEGLEWWWQQTRRRALNEVTQMMFADQRWADYMPSLFGHHLLKDPGCNVAYWNLHTRQIRESGPGRYVVGKNAAPLRFFHFSGFDPRTSWLLSRHQGDRPRILLSEDAVLASLCDEYAAALDRAGFSDCAKREYGWSHSADGLDMSGRIRRLYWSAVMAAERGDGPEPPDPFDVEEPEAFTAWLNTPDERGPRGPRRWSRYVHAIWQSRSDVRAHFVDVAGEHAEPFANWLRVDGVGQEQIPERLMPPLSPDATHASASESIPLPHGLNVTGYFRAELGVGEAARLLTRAVDATGTAYATRTQPAPHSRQQHDFEDRDAADVPFDVNLLCLNADCTAEFAHDAGPAFFADRYTIGYWFWEVDPLPATMHRAFDHVDEVWAATEYMARIFRAAGRKPVHIVPLPLPAPPARTEMLTRAHLELPADRFIFLFVFDFLSVLERKNPLGAIEAFCSAFAPDEGPVLVLKSINGHRCVPQLERVRRAAAHRPDILIRDGYVSPDEKNALLSTCDAYVSLHRAEGLGLTLAEAMALGKPAIATGYSGNRHFMTDENSFLVEFTLASASGDCGPYPAGARWAEPSVSHAASLMRAVYEHPQEAARRADRARADMLFHHGVMASASAIARRLDAIREEREALATAAAAEAAATSAAVSVEESAPELLPETEPAPAPQPETAAPVAAPAPAAAEVSTAAGTAAGSPALEAFDAAIPELRLLGHPRLSVDGRAWPRLRRAAQRAMFRVIRPYWYQQRQFQDALLDAVHASIERLTTPADQPTSHITPTDPAVRPIEPPVHANARRGDDHVGR